MQTTNTQEVIQIGKKPGGKFDMRYYGCEIDDVVSILMGRPRMIAPYKPLIRISPCEINFRALRCP